mgnify:CR=1 FL=1
MVHVYLFEETKSFLNNFFFFGDDKEELNELRISLDTNGVVWTLEDYPLSINCVKENNDEVFKKFKYFIFRVMNDIEVLNAYMTNLSPYISLMNGENITIEDDKCRYGNLLRDAILSKKFDLKYEGTLNNLVEGN